jgi:hypothetical protein
MNSDYKNSDLKLDKDYFPYKLYKTTQRAV